MDIVTSIKARRFQLDRTMLGHSLDVAARTRSTEPAVARIDEPSGLRRSSRRASICVQNNLAPYPFYSCVESVAYTVASLGFTAGKRDSPHGLPIFSSSNRA